MKANKTQKAPRDDVLPGHSTTFENTGEFAGKEFVEESIQVVKTRSGALAYDESPFLQNYKIDTKKQLLTVSTGSAIIQNGTEKVSAVTRVQQEVEVDKKQFVKLFSGPELKHVFNLDVSGLRMFIVFIDLLGRPENMNRVHIRCTYKHVENITSDSDEKFSYMTFNRGMKNLIQHGYIAAAIIDGETTGWFWINQDRFYNGSTVLLVKKVKLTTRNKAHKARVERAVFPGPKETMNLFDDQPESFDESFGE